MYPIMDLFHLVPYYFWSFMKRKNDTFFKKIFLVSHYGKAQASLILLLLFFISCNGYNCATSCASPGGYCDEFVFFSLLL